MTQGEPQRTAVSVTRCQAFLRPSQPWRTNVAPVIVAAFIGSEKVTVRSSARAAPVPVGNAESTSGRVVSPGGRSQ